MTAFLDALDGPLPDVLRYVMALWFAGTALYLVWCGRQLQREQAETDRLTEGKPPALTLVTPPPGCNLPNEGKACEPGGIPNAQRLRLERVL